MPTTIVEIVVSTTTVTETVVAATACAARTVDMCKDQTLPKLQDWSLLGLCLIIVPTLILSCVFMNKQFTAMAGGPDSQRAQTGLERLWNWTVSLAWRKRAKKQRAKDGRKVTIFLSATQQGFY